MLRLLWVLLITAGGLIVVRTLILFGLLHSALTALTGRRLRWQTMTRTGDLATAPREGV